jgi:hypothetical protein
MIGDVRINQYQQFPRSGGVARATPTAVAAGQSQEDALEPIVPVQAVHRSLTFHNMPAENIRMETLQARDDLRGQRVDIFV